MPARRALPALPALPAGLRRLTPDRLRDEVHVRALAIALGAIPPRTMHSEQDARVLLDAVGGALRAAEGEPGRVVEIGVYEGSSAVALCAVLPAGAELHLVDPFGHHPDALPSGWGATEWATRRVVARAAGRRGSGAPRVCWHVQLSHELAAGWSGPAHAVFIDGDHSEAGCELDWQCWREHVPVGGFVVFHDARLGRAGGRGLPGPTAVVDRHFRAEGTPGWEIAAEADRTVAVRRAR